MSEPEIIDPITLRPDANTPEEQMVCELVYQFKLHVRIHIKLNNSFPYSRRIYLAPPSFHKYLSNYAIAYTKQ